VESARAAYSLKKHVAVKKRKEMSLNLEKAIEQRESFIC
jgi:hypothetical protein